MNEPQTCSAPGPCDGIAIYFYERPNIKRYYLCANCAAVFFLGQLNAMLPLRRVDEEDITNPGNAC